MIFLFGTRTVNLASIESLNAICSSCNTQGSIVIHLYRRHVHLFWIPLFPLKKSGVAECQHCKRVYRPGEMDDQLRSEFNQIKKDTKGPIWQFAALLGILALYIIFTIWAIMMN